MPVFYIFPYMRKTEKTETARLLTRGKKELEHGRLPQAIRHLREAVESCSVDDRLLLSGCLYWLTIALLRAGKKETALKSLSSARKIMHCGFIKRLFNKMSNEYGMIRRGCAKEDDCAAFYSLKLTDFFMQKGKVLFSSEMERELVLRLITDSWVKLIERTSLEGYNVSEKLFLFQSTEIEYPFLPSSHVKNERIAEVIDFRTGKMLAPEAICPCGSGLPYARCCGKTKNLEDFRSICV
jgi:hypothetical protein